MIKPVNSQYLSYVKQWFIRLIVIIERPLKLESNSPSVSPLLTKKQLQAVLSTELKRTVSQEKTQGTLFEITSQCS